MPILQCYNPPPEKEKKNAPQSLNSLSQKTQRPTPSAALPAVRRPLPFVLRLPLLDPEATDAPPAADSSSSSAAPFPVGSSPTSIAIPASDPSSSSAAFLPASAAAWALRSSAAVTCVAFRWMMDVCVDA